MSAVGRLVFTYFLGASPLRWLSVVSWVLAPPSCIALILLPRLLAGPSGPGIVQTFILSGVVPAFFGVFFGAALMPVVFGHLAFSRTIDMLPHGRSKLLASIVVTVLLVALVWTTLLTGPYLAMPIDTWIVLRRALIAAFLIVSLLYLVIWFISRSRTATGLLGSCLLLLVSLILPLRFIAVPERAAIAPLLIGLLVWSMLVIAFLMWPRLQSRLEVVRQACSRRASWFRLRYTPGRAVDFLLGTHRPWLFALGQLLPMAIAPMFLYSPGTWLYFLAILSAITGAISSFAPGRGRALWLRTEWSRRELFLQIEAAHWRQNGHALCVQLVALVLLGSLHGFPTVLLAFGMPLLVLTTAASTNLGLLITHGIGWRESIAAIASSIVAMAALSFRSIALRRWERLDWMLCRRTEPRLGVRAAV